VLILKVIFLGTASAEGYPATFCRCERCTLARKLGGKNFRARASVCIDNDLLIDIPPDVYVRSIEFGIEMNRIRYILITHSHEDHFYFYELRLRKWPFIDSPLDIVKIFCNDTVAKTLKRYFRGELRNLKIRIKALTPYETTKVGAYNVTPIPAVHSTRNKYEVSFNYIIEKNGKKLLYACDTGPYPKKTLDYLSELKLDAVIIEATMGVAGSNIWPYHMGFNEVITFKKWLCKHNVLTPNSPFVITHFSHLTCPLHEEMERIVSPHCITVAYDGFAFEI